MPLYEGTRTATVAAAPREAFAVMTDYERLPEWQTPLRDCRVLSRYDNGLGREVEYVVDAKVRQVTYTLRHTYEEPVEIGSEYVEGDFETFEGRWRFDAAGEGRARACLEVRIDPGLPLPRPVLAMVNRRVLRTAVEDLARRLEDG